ncbi:MAG: HepT-like ribonuclease domain-containing protein [Janthinobacterium lividum]
MRRDQLSLASYLDHIRDAIERIDRYTRDMVEPAFLENELIQDAVIRNLEIIGEARACPQSANSYSIEKFM